MGSLLTGGGRRPGHASYPFPPGVWIPGPQVGPPTRIFGKKRGPCVMPKARAVRRLSKDARELSERHTMAARGDLQHISWRYSSRMRPKAKVCSTRFQWGNRGNAARPYLLGPPLRDVHRPIRRHGDGRLRKRATTMERHAPECSHRALAPKGKEEEPCRKFR